MVKKNQEIIKAEKLIGSPTELFSREKLHDLIDAQHQALKINQDYKVDGKLTKEIKKYINSYFDL